MLVCQQCKRLLCRNCIFVIRLICLMFDDAQIFKKFRLRWGEITAITDSAPDELEMSKSRNSLTTLFHVLIALWYYANGAFEDTVGDNWCAPVYWRLCAAQYKGDRYIPATMCARCYSTKKLLQPCRSFSNDTGPPCLSALMAPRSILKHHQNKKMNL